MCLILKMKIERYVCFCYYYIVYKIVNKAWNTHAPDEDCGLGEPWNQAQLEYINQHFKTETSFKFYVSDDINADELKVIFGKANFSYLRNKYNRQSVPLSKPATVRMEISVIVFNFKILEVICQLTSNVKYQDRS